ncbi:PA0069 family radical SAM protein [Methyloceanibacter sp.]|uniref:PA0069 family radical SAM protein n=1 Tax=Methyloceanibacter sp. TaxID=1965321 RepID=UPI0025EDE43F|nr:PA0069 family radical SAM protein [Methyloceanibacter sp.]
MGRTIAVAVLAAIASKGRKANPIFYVLDLFCYAAYIRGMSIALRKPNRDESLPHEAGGIAYGRRHGRGAQTNRSGRFEARTYEPVDDGWDSLGDLEALRTEVQETPARRIITKNDSPDIGFDRSINPYRGCEHGCVYCFARPTHAFLGMSPGLDFETKLFAKTNAAHALERELAAPDYRPRMIAIGSNTDPYQPVERRYRIMRRILEVLNAANHPVGIVTKSALVLRDLDILQSMAERGLVKVALSVTTLDRKLARAMEPRASTPDKRLEAIETLASAGIPASVMVAPVVPGLTDAEIERILERASAAGAAEAGYILLRLPLEIGDLFVEWLEANCPDRANRVLSLVRQTRGGKLYDAQWQSRMEGDGPYAWMIGRRFQMAAERLGLDKRHKLRTDLFTPPTLPGQQLSLL